MSNHTLYEADVVTALHPLFKTIIWAAQARSTDDTRHALMHLHIEREGMVHKIVATDGKRLHVGTYDPGLLDGDIEDLVPGDYEVIAKTPKLIVLKRDTEGDVNFPDWRTILPRDGRPRLPLALTRANVALIGVKTNRLLATDYAHQACGFGCGFGKDEWVPAKVSEDGPNAVVCISHELGEAYIMPMRVDGAEDVESEADATPELDGVPACAGHDAEDDDDGHVGPLIVDIDGKMG